MINSEVKIKIKKCNYNLLQKKKKMNQLYNQLYNQMCDNHKYTRA